MDNLVKKLHLIKENPGYYNALSPEEQAELFIFLLTPKKKIFQKPVEIKGKDGVTPVKDVDYLSLEKTHEALAEIERKVQAKLSEIRQPEDGKDAVITPELIDSILGQVLALVEIPEYVPYDDTALTERIENAELDHAELRDEVDTLKKNVATQFVGGGVSANWVKNYVNSKTYSVSDLDGMDVATTGQVPTKQADGTWAPATPGGTGSSAWGAITGTLSDQTDLQNALNAKAPALGADDNYVTDAEKTKLSNLSGVNTGDQTIKDVFGITVDGGGSTPSTGTKGYRYIEQNCTITGWHVQGDVSGSIVFDVKRGGTSIAGTEKPTLSSQQTNSDTTLTTWTTSLSAGDIIEFVIDSASTLTRATLTVLVTKI